MMFLVFVLFLFKPNGEISDATKAMKVGTQTCHRISMTTVSRMVLNVLFHVVQKFRHLIAQAYDAYFGHVGTVVGQIKVLPGTAVSVDEESWRNGMPTTFHGKGFQLEFSNAERTQGQGWYLERNASETTQGWR